MEEVKTKDVEVRKPQLYARGGGVLPIIPQSIDEVWRIAGAVVDAGLAPKGIDTKEKATVIIMHGLEVGLAPFAALQSIAVINGKPSLYGDGALAVVRASGLLEKFSETIATEEIFGIKATCLVKRRGENPLRRTFTKVDAEKAGLWGKPGPWQTYPNRMLQMRARAFALRDAFADVMKGLGIREEIEDIVPDLDLVPPPPPPPPDMQTPLERAIAKAKESNGDKLADQQVIWDEEIERPRTEADRL